jgi:hypothetical protein
MKTANLGLRFLLELALLAALAVWGFSLGSTWLSVVAGIGAPVMAACVWGLWIAPKSERRLTDPTRLVLELLLFTAAAIALAATGRTALAAVLVALVLVQEVLMHLWHQRAIA